MTVSPLVFGRRGHIVSVKTGQVGIKLCWTAECRIFKLHWNNSVKICCFQNKAFKPDHALGKYSRTWYIVVLHRTLLISTNQDSFRNDKAQYPKGYILQPLFKVEFPVVHPGIPGRFRAEHCPVYRQQHHLAFVGPVIRAMVIRKDIHPDTAYRTPRHWPGAWHGMGQV